MTATYLGGGTLGDAVPGLQEELGKVGEALEALKGVVDSNIGKIGDVQDKINGAAGDLNDAKNDLTAGPLADLQNAVDTAQAGLDDLANVGDAGAWLTDIINKLDETKSFLEGLNSATHLQNMIDAVNAGVDGAQAKVDGMQDDLEQLTDVESLVEQQTALLGEVESALQDASNAAIGGVIAYTEQVSQLLNSGVHVVYFNGSLSALGSEVDGVLPDTGFDSSAQVAGPLLIVDIANTAAFNALKAAFGLP